MKYKPTIGLEIHAELKTKTKMFCGCLNDLDEKHPNINICPICMGHPGTLPVANKEAVKMVLRVGLALSGQLADYTQFDRKNYFYPDLPKGYQISQYKFPLVGGGVLGSVNLARIHLEEDAGRLIHQKDNTLVDFNRAGIPLMELVTEPVISSAEEARMFARELRLLLRYLGVSDADMEKGQMRVEANISLLPQSQISNLKSQKLGVKVEVKNLNSFRAVKNAINYEIKRQAGILDKRREIVQETRGWDEKKQKTFSQREKEEAHDYRYFPEPDIPPFKISEMKEFQNLESTIPELPWNKRKRLKKEYRLNNENVEMLVNDGEFANFFEEIISEIKTEEQEVPDKKIVDLTVNYLTSDLAGLMKEKFLNFDSLLVSPENFADLMNMILENKISSRVAKNVLKEMVETGVEPHVFVKEKGLEQKSDSSFIETEVKKVINDKDYESVVKDYKEGKENVMHFLLGRVMMNTKGAASPQKAKEILKKLLK